MGIIEKLGYFVWYGAFVLIGITLGLIINPGIARAEILFDNLTVPPTSYNGSASMNTDQVTYNTTDTFMCAVISAPSETYYITDITVPIAPYHSNVYGNYVEMRIYELGNSTSSLVGLTLTDPYVSENTVQLSTLDTTFSTSTFTFDYVPIEAGTFYCVSFYDTTEVDDISTSNRVNWRRSSVATTTNFILPDVPVGAYNGMYVNAYDDFNDISLYSSNIYLQKVIHRVEGSTTAPPLGGSPTSYITDVYPPDEAYSVATTSYVNMTVQIPASRYEQNNWKAKIACAEVTEQTWFQSLVDYGFSYTVDLLDEDCSDGAQCTPHGVSYPPEGEIDTNSVYNCRASLLESKWYWFDTVVESQQFRFYTFSSTSTDEFAQLIARADEIQGNVNLTGTSTNPVFGDCSILTGHIADCVIEPVKFLLIPSGTDRENIKDLIDTTVFDKFPFSYIGIFNQEMASTSFFATTSAEFPDFTFDIYRAGHGTTTITIFDGSQFVSSWATVDEFETLKTAIQYALVIMFTTILYFRVRRLVPSGDNVKGI